MQGEAVPTPLSSFCSCWRGALLETSGWSSWVGSLSREGEGKSESPQQNGKGSLATTDTGNGNFILTPKALVKTVPHHSSMGQYHVRSVIARSYPSPLRLSLPEAPPHKTPLPTHPHLHPHEQRPLLPTADDPRRTPEAPQRLDRMPSMALSETSLSNHQLRAPTPDSVLLHDRSSFTPEKSLLQLQQAVGGAVYRFIIETHRALKISKILGFTNTTRNWSTEFKSYGLRGGHFRKQKIPTTARWKLAYLYFELIKKMRTPIGTHKGEGSEMNNIRIAARRVQKDVGEIQNVIRITFEEIAISVQENSSDAPAEGFIPLSAPDVPVLAETLKIDSARRAGSTLRV